MSVTLIKPHLNITDRLFSGLLYFRSVFSSFNLEALDRLINLGYKYGQINKHSIELADLGLERSDFKHYELIPMYDLPARKDQHTYIALDTHLARSIASEVLPIYYWIRE